MTVRNIARVLFHKEIRRAQGEESQKNKSKIADKSEYKSEDSAQISVDAKSIHAVHQEIVANASATSSVEKAKDIEEVKSRVAEGYYDRPEVVKEIASAILKSGDIMKASEIKEKYQKIQTRIEGQFYSKPDVVEEVAERVLAWLN